MERIITEVYEEVEKRCMMPSNAYSVGSWTHHIKLVYEIAIKNCVHYGANRDVVALAALLHDVASITNKDFSDEHHIIGAQIAEEILSKYDISHEKIELIKKCILNHRGSRLREKNTPEEICIADSDAMAHFHSIPSLLRMAYVEKGMNINDGVEFVSNKLERSYNKLSEEGKKIIENEYQASKILLRKLG